MLLGLAWDSGCWLCVGVLSLWVWIWLFDLVTWCGLGLGGCFGVWFGGCFGDWIPLYLGSYGFAYVVVGSGLTVFGVLMLFGSLVVSDGF